MLTLLLVMVALLAFVNGANDNCKGVATLVGYGAASPRRALVWAALSTAIGAAFSFWAAAGLIKAFSGFGLFTTGITLNNPFFLAVLAGAVGWIALATVTGLPVSTTHAITGALCGAGMLSFGSAMVQWNVLGQKFALPLALSPVLSLATVYALAFPVVYLVGRYSARCACLRTEPIVANTGAAAVGGMTTIVVDDAKACTGDAGVTGSAVAVGVHWFTSGMVGFARGWNDAPKIAALVIGALGAAQLPGGTALAFAIVTISMAAGGLLAGRKVLETLSKNVTPMPLAESLTASAVTATLVSLASWNALPVSTTHVSTGAIVGVGLKHDPKSVKWAKVSQIVLSWVVTLPVAAALAAGVAWVVRMLHWQ